MTAARGRGETTRRVTVVVEVGPAGPHLRGAPVPPGERYVARVTSGPREAYVMRRAPTAEGALHGVIATLRAKGYSGVAKVFYR